MNALVKRPGKEDQGWDFLQPHHPPWCLPALKRPLGDQGSSPSSAYECLSENLPVAPVFLFESWGNVGVVAICQGTENSIAQGF